MTNFIEKLKTDKSLQIKCGAAVLALIVLITGLSLIINAANTIKLTDYVVVNEVEGYDGYATVTYEIDAVSFARKLFGDKDVEDIPFAALAFATEETAKELFDIKIENNGYFSNGDTAEIVVEFNSMHNFGKKIKGGTIKQKISGLEEAKVIDLFEKIEVSFSGINGEGSISNLTPDYDKNNEFWIGSIVCETENNGKLSNGDKITVTATINANSYDSLKERCLNNGYVLPEKQEKSYTVKNLAEYMTKDDIKGTFLEDIEKEAKEEIGGLATPTIRSIIVYWGENTSEDARGTAAFVIVNYYKPSSGEHTKCIAFTDCYKTVVDGTTVCTYSSQEKISLGASFYAAMSEEQVLAKIKADYPNYTFTKIK